MPQAVLRRRLPLRVLRAVGIGLVVLLVLAGVVRAALDPLAARWLRRSLASVKDVEGTFSDLHVAPLKLTLTVHRLEIAKRTAARWAKPLFYAEEIEMGLYWRELLHGHLVAGARLWRPKVNLIAAPSKAEQQTTEVPDVATQLHRTAPFKFDRVEVRDGELLFTDATKQEHAELWLHGVEATLENVATRAALDRGEPSVLALSGTLQRTGRLSVYVTANPLAKTLTFAGQAHLAGLDLRELGAFVASEAGVTPVQGTLDLSARFAAEGGRITGGVRPVLAHAKVQQATPGLFERLKAALVDAALSIFSDRVPSRDAVATTIPIHGTVKGAGAEAWPTIFGILRNAFVTGVTSSVTGLPPKGGVPVQARGTRPGGGSR